MTGNGVAPASTKLARVIRDKGGNIIATRDEAKRYVLGKLEKRPNSQAWNKAAKLLLEDADEQGNRQAVTVRLVHRGHLGPAAGLSKSYVSKAVWSPAHDRRDHRPRGAAGRTPKLAPHNAAIRARVAAHPDATLEELQSWLAEERDIEVSNSALVESGQADRGVGVLTLRRALSRRPIP
jgi:transposase